MITGLSIETLDHEGNSFYINNYESWKNFKTQKINF